MVRPRVEAGWLGRVVMGAHWSDVTCQAACQSPAPFVTSIAPEPAPFVTLTRPICHLYGAQPVDLKRKTVPESESYLRILPTRRVLPGDNPPDRLATAAATPGCPPAPLDPAAGWNPDTDDREPRPTALQAPAGGHGRGGPHRWVAQPPPSPSPPSWRILAQGPRPRPPIPPKPPAAILAHI
jgi:hypothetical protein